MPEEMTNSRMSRLISIEVITGFLCSAVFTAVAVGIAWGSQEEKTAALTDDVSGLKKEVRSIDTAVSTIKTDVAVTKRDVSHLKEKLDEASRQQDEILRILRTNYPRD